MPLQLIDLKLVFPQVLLGSVTVPVAFQLALETAVGTLNLCHLSGREAKTERWRETNFNAVNVKVTHAVNSR